MCIRDSVLNTQRRSPRRLVAVRHGGWSPFATEARASHDAEGEVPGLDRGFLDEQGHPDERLTCAPDTVGEGEHLNVGSHAELLPSIVGDLTRDDREVTNALVAGPVEDTADDLAVEARRVELALTGDHELGVVELELQSGGACHDIEARLQRGSD